MGQPGRDETRDVRIFEVGPRDGLQNESAVLAVTQRVELIERLVEAGARDVEIGSFVHPRWVPQMVDTDEVARRIERAPGVNYWALAPNMKGVERALEADVEHLAFFISASETHNQKNLNRGIDESMAELEEMFVVARAHGLTVRAYISMVFGCPYEGEIAFDRVMDIAHALVKQGAAMISFGDTTGIGTPPQVRRECARAVEELGTERVALHLHDTRGMGITNAMVAWESGGARLRRFGGGHRRVPLRAGRGGEPGHRGPAVSAGQPGHRLRDARRAAQPDRGLARGRGRHRHPLAVHQLSAIAARGLTGMRPVARREQHSATNMEPRR